MYCAANLALHLGPYKQNLPQGTEVQLLRKWTVAEDPLLHKSAVTQLPATRAAPAESLPVLLRAVGDPVDELGDEARASLKNLGVQPRLASLTC